MKLVLIALLALAAPALALAEEPTGFRDIPWGATEATLRAKVPLSDCYPSGQIDFGTRRCSAADGLRFGAVVPQSVTFYFRDARLVAWAMLYHRNWRPTMVPALLERYGKPTEEGRTAATWTGARTRIIVTMDYSESDYLQVVTQQEIRLHAADRKRAAEKTSKGF